MPNFKQDFIKHVLNDEGNRYLKNQGLEMQKRLHFHTHRVFNDRSKKVTDEAGGDGELTIKHTAVERFLDIKRKSRNRNTNRIKHHRIRIHNRFVFGHYFSIANRLMNEYIEAATEAIKQDFNAFNNG